MDDRRSGRALENGRIERNAVADSSGNGNNGTLTNAQETGTADAGSSSSTIIDLDATFYNADDSFNGMILYIAGGSGCAVATGTERTITDYASTTKSFTVAPLSGEADNCNFEIRHQTGGKFGNGLGFDYTNDSVQSNHLLRLIRKLYHFEWWIYRSQGTTVMYMLFARIQVVHSYIFFFR